MSLCPEDFLLEDALAQVRCQENRDEPVGTRRPERQGKGPTGIAHVFALKGAGVIPCDGNSSVAPALVYKAGLTFKEVMVEVWEDVLR